MHKFFLTLGIVLFLVQKSFCGIYPDSKADSIRALNYSQYKAEMDRYIQEQYNELDYYKTYNLYNKKILDYNTTIYGWQHKTTIIIFFVVILIVLCGLVFSGIQFYLSIKKINIATSNIAKLDTISQNNPNQLTSSQQPTDKDSRTNLSLSTKGIEIQTSLIGVLILVISIAFFSLYLIYVYPIKSDAGKSKVLDIKESSK